MGVKLKNPLKSRLRDKKSSGCAGNRVWQNILYKELLKIINIEKLFKYNVQNCNLNFEKIKLCYI